MKFKHVVASLSLAMFTAFGVAAGLSMKKEVKSVAAEGEKTWMFRAQLDLGECSPCRPDSVFGDDSVVAVKFHVWGQNIDETFNAQHMYEVFSKDVFAVHVALADNQTVDGAQWILTQKNSGDKCSIDITEFGDDEVEALDKNTDIKLLLHTYQHSWVGGKWTFTSTCGDSTSDFKAQVGISDYVDYPFVKDPANNRFSILGMTLEGDKALGFEADGIVFGSNIQAMLDERSKEYAYDGQPNWFFLPSGTYDFFLYEATLSIRRQGTENSYIYFVSQSDADDSGLYAYTYGGSETFGGWPGTAVTEQALDGLVEVDLRNGLHFQGQEHKVFRIPVDMSYPSGADHIIFHNGSDETKSVEFELVPGAAYWHTAPAAVKRAGVVLDILYNLQIKLKDSGSYDYGGIDLNNSVCAISSSDAATLYNAYDELSDEEKASYIDSSWVRTYTGSGASLGWRTLTEVFVELGKRAGIISSSSSFFSADMNNGSVAVIVICVSTASALALTLLLVFKKRKHQ